MTTMRTYGDGCAIAQALDLVGERWALLGVRERAGVVRRQKLPPPAGSRVYELTDWGRELEQTVLSLGHWAGRSPSGLASDAPVGTDSMILALRSRFDADAAHGLRARFGLTLNED